MLNIATLAAAATAAIHLKGPDGVPLYDGDKPVRIIVHGPGTRPFAMVQSRESARSFKRLQDNDGKMVPPTAEESLAETAEDLTTLTVAFENFTYGDGSLAGEAMHRAAYADPSIGFITKQVRKFIGDWGNFKNGSATS